jgi:hypothetical protein
MKASHCFNVLDARGAISVTERQKYILRVRKMARTAAESHVEKRKALGFPLTTPREFANVLRDGCRRCGSPLVALEEGVAGELLVDVVEEPSELFFRARRRELRRIHPQPCEARAPMGSIAARRAAQVITGARFVELVRGDRDPLPLTEEVGVAIQAQEVDGGLDATASDTADWQRWVGAQHRELVEHVHAHPRVRRITRWIDQQARLVVDLVAPGHAPGGSRKIRLRPTPPAKAITPITALRLLASRNRAREWRCR